MGKSAHDVSAASGYLRGGDAGGIGNDDGGGGGKRWPGERRAVAHSGPAVQERPVRGQATQRRRPGSQLRWRRRLPAPVPARVQSVVVERLEREHPEGDIETVAAQPVPVGAQQGVQRAEQHGQRGVRGRLAPDAARAAPAPAEHGQVAVGERDRQVADIAGGVERVAARLQVVVPAVQDAPGPDVRAQLRRGPDPGRSHQARVPGGRGGAQPARRDRPRLRVRAHAVPPERAVRVAEQDVEPAQLPDDQLGVRAVRQPVQHARGTGRDHFRLRQHRDRAPVAQRRRAHVLLQPQLHGGRQHTKRHFQRYVTRCARLRLRQ